MVVVMAVIEVHCTRIQRIRGRLDRSLENTVAVTVAAAAASGESRHGRMLWRMILMRRGVLRHW